VARQGAQTNNKGESVEIEELVASEKKIGQIYPVVKDAHGNILDGFHRKRVNPDWKEVVLPIEDELEALRIRVHLNDLRRDVPTSEKEKWIQQAREILQKRGFKGTQEEIAKAIGLSRTWVTHYDTNPIQPHVNFRQESVKMSGSDKFFGYNVWGFKDDSWKNQIQKGDPKQPDKEFYHGSTPAFVIHQLIEMFQPKRVLDSMAGVGTTGFVCGQHGVECDQFDIYPYPKYGVQEGDAEFIETDEKYDLIFNHIPYLNMVKYGEAEHDLSNMREVGFFGKVYRIFQKNHSLLRNDGIYAVLVGDWRYGGKLIPITAKVTMLALQAGFVLFDEAIKLTAEQKGKALQEYRASKFGYLAQAFDMVLIFRKA